MITAFCRDFFGELAGGFGSQDGRQADAADGAHRKPADFHEGAARQSVAIATGGPKQSQHRRLCPSKDAGWVVVRQVGKGSQRGGQFQRGQSSGGMSRSISAGVRTLQRLLMSDFRINRPAASVKSIEIGVLCRNRPPPRFDRNGDETFVPSESANRFGRRLSRQREDDCCRSAKALDSGTRVLCAWLVGSALSPSRALPNSSQSGLDFHVPTRDGETSSLPVRATGRGKARADGRGDRADRRGRRRRCPLLLSLRRQDGLGFQSHRPHGTRASENRGSGEALAQTDGDSSRRDDDGRLHAFQGDGRPGLPGNRPLPARMGSRTGQPRQPGFAIGPAAVLPAIRDRALERHRNARGLHRRSDRESEDRHVLPRGRSQRSADRQHREPRHRQRRGRPLLSDADQFDRR